MSETTHEVTPEQAEGLAAMLDERRFPFTDGYGRPLALSVRLGMAIGLAGPYERRDPAGLTALRQNLMGVEGDLLWCLSRHDNKGAHKDSLREAAGVVRSAVRALDGTAALAAEVARLRTALHGIATMPEHDQDDAHRLRDKARAALSITPEPAA